mgnify:FL=1
MLSQQLLERIVRKEEMVVPVLFKPVQFKVLKKIMKKETLNENEKRYLRGGIQKKMNAVQECMREDSDHNGKLRTILQSLGQYYITGLEALRHNGYGWYYKSKIIEVINTSITGSMRIRGLVIKFIRVKSFKKMKMKTDKKSGLVYAINEQILKDVTYTKNEYTRNVWNQMFNRYGSIFNPLKVQEKRESENAIPYHLYGV